MAVTLLPCCEKCDEPQTVDAVGVTIEQECFFLLLQARCIECGKTERYRWTVETLLRWAFNAQERETEKEVQPSGAVRIPEKLGITH